jgi:hypothetical protein
MHAIIGWWGNMAIRWGECKYDRSDRGTDTGVIILGKWDERGKTWGEYRVESGRI